MSSAAIVVDNLSKTYRIGAVSSRHYRTLRDDLANFIRRIGKFQRSKKEEFSALRDISFEIPHGQVVGVIGRNGAGKSTLLRVLSRITFPTTGRVRINGRVGSLLEVGTGFHPELTGRENIFLSGAILGMSKREIKNQFDAIVDFSGVERFLDTPVKRYSSGMTVRLGFAVAAHLQPEILLVDEVLAVGDAAFQKKCVQRVHDVARGGRTVLFVSHSLGVIESLCDRCLLLEDGRLIADGPAAETIDKYMASGMAPDGEVDLGARERKRKKIWATNIRIRNHLGDVSASLPAGSECSFELEFDMEPGAVVNSPSFGIGFETLNGQKITRCITRETLGEIPTVEEPGRIVLQLPSLNLVPGNYVINVGISDTNDQLDFVENALQFEITPSRVYPTGKLPPREMGFTTFFPCTWDTEYAKEKVEQAR